MNIIYDSIKTFSKQCTFMLADDGNYFLPGIDSKYQGLFIYKKGKMFKVIDSILAKTKVEEIKYNLFNVIQKRKGLQETYWLYKDTLILEQTKSDEREIILDIKESYDNRQWGRNYEIEDDKGTIVVKFTKTTSQFEDSSEGEKEYEFYLAIAGEKLEFKKHEEWVKKEYSLDMIRNSPFERYVLDALTIRSHTFAFSASENKDEAIKKARYAINNLDKVKLAIRRKYEKTQIKLVKNKELKLAFKTASNSLNQLIVDDKGIFAGLPWFFQFWSRDELISIKGLMINGNFKVAKNIILRNLKHIQPDGRLLNQTLPVSEVTNADAIGWLFKRVQDYQKLKGFTSREKTAIKKKLIKSIADLKKYHFEEGLLKNSPLETWMDTEWEMDNRSGFNIEIQAMYMNMLKLAYDLTKEKKYKDEEINMRLLVKKKFLKRKNLYDSAYDEIIRPNIFIAAYIYPQLFSNKEWKEIFKPALRKLWLSWGGLSTIDKQHPLFMGSHTGEVPQSYHRGDSWFWINDLAALVMYKTDKKEFQKQIEKILKADIDEILTRGIAGAHSELSSAKKLESNGCLNQAWSNAFFIELVNEIN